MTVFDWMTPLAAMLSEKSKTDFRVAVGYTKKLKKLKVRKYNEQYIGLDGDWYLFQVENKHAEKTMRFLEKHRIPYGIDK